VCLNTTMIAIGQTSAEVEPLPDGTARKRAYVTPQLEKLGTIRELTLGTGMNGDFDATQPPGQNKSRI